MNLFPKMRIAVKLPLLVVISSLLVSGALATYSFVKLRTAILETSETGFALLTDARAGTVERMFEWMSRDVALFAQTPGVASAVSDFRSGFRRIQGDRVGTLQAGYIENNPNSAMERELLDRGETDILYDEVHVQLHPGYRRLKQSYGYYDVFLFDTDGDLIYTVAKEADFATNFLDGPYATSGLGQVVQAALNAEPGELFFADFAPYAPSGGAMASFMASPVFDVDGHRLGVYAIQVSIEEIMSIVTEEAGLGETGEVYLVGPDNTLRTPLRSDGVALGGSTAGASYVQRVLEGELIENSTEIGFDAHEVVVHGVPIEVHGAVWALIGEIDHAEIVGPANREAARMGLFVLIGAVVLMAISWMVAQSLIRPLGRMQNGLDWIKEKRFDISFDDASRSDEIGQLAQGLEEMKEALSVAHDAEMERAKVQEGQKRVVEEMSHALESLAQGDLSRPITTPFVSDYETLRENYNAAIAKFGETIATLEHHAEEIRSRADRMSDESADLSRRTENQAASLEQTAAAIHELTESVAEAAEGAKEIDQIVSQTRGQADESVPVVRDAVAAMTEIENASAAITQIISVIDDIAFQTNLLALNAGVEAARAGEAGRGFAVVASEVRALAQRSSDAAREIKTIISGSSEQVAKGVDLVGRAGEVLTTIVDGITNIANLMGGIAKGAEEQASGLSEVNIGVTQLDRVTQQNASMVEAATTASNELKLEGHALNSLIASFTLSPSTVRDRNGSAPAGSLHKSSKPPVGVVNPVRDDVSESDSTIEGVVETFPVTGGLHDQPSEGSKDAEETSGPRSEKPSKPFVPVQSSNVAAGGNAAEAVWEDF